MHTKAPFCNMENRRQTSSQKSMLRQTHRFVSLNSVCGKELGQTDRHTHMQTHRYTLKQTATNTHSQPGVKGVGLRVRAEHHLLLSANRISIQCDPQHVLHLVHAEDSILPFKHSAFVSSFSSEMNSFQSVNSLICICLQCVVIIAALTVRERQQCHRCQITLHALYP